MDDQVDIDKPPLALGNPKGPITNNSLNSLSLPVSYVRQRYGESGYTRGNRNPLAWPATSIPAPQNRILKVSTTGKKEYSGFVHNMSSIQTLGQTVDDPQRFLTFYKSDFCDSPGLAQAEDGMRPVFQGSGLLPKPVHQSLQESGFTRGTRNPLAWPTFLRPDPLNSTPKARSLSNHKIIGRKECSGFVHNMPNLQGLGNSWKDPQRFLTNYQSTFCNVATFRVKG